MGPELDRLSTIPSQSPGWLFWHFGASPSLRWKMLWLRDFIPARRPWGCIQTVPGSDPSRTGFFIVAGFCIVVMMCGYWGFGNWVKDNATWKQGKGLGAFKCWQEWAGIFIGDNENPSFPKILGIRLATSAGDWHRLGAAELALRSLPAWPSLPRDLFASSQAGSWLKVAGYLKT